MVITIHLLLFFAYINYVLSYNIKNNLTIQQWTKIREIMKHPSCTVPIREKLNAVLFNKYEEWAYYHARLFKKKHRFLCKDIKLDELNLFALSGLNKSITNYNPDYIFYKYATIYIYSYLHDGVSKQQTMNIVPRHIRKDKNHPWRLKNKERYLNLLDPIFLGDDDFKLNEFIDEKNNPSKISEYNNSLLELWISIKSELNLFSYKVFTYKYNIEFDKVMSDEKIAILMGCSEETIRKSLKETTKILKLKLNI